MDDLIGVIIFALIAIIGPLLERSRRKQQPPPPQQRRVPRPTEEVQPQVPRRVQSTTQPRQTEEVSAATMLPDELWEVLTGQRPLPRPVPAPVPAPDVEDEETIDEEFEVAESTVGEDVNVETRTTAREEAVSLETSPRREHPIVVSMESTLPTPRARHAAFHAKLESGPTQALPAVLVRDRIKLRGREDLRRAMLLRTILGPPRSLE